MNETTKIMPGAITHTLLIWESEDRRAILVLIPNSVLNERDFEMFRSVHGRTLNGDDCTEQQTEIIQATSKALSMRLDGAGKPARFSSYVVDNGEGMAGNEVRTAIEEVIITRIYRTGWF